jgi:hypothetical protein
MNKQYINIIITFIASIIILLGGNPKVYGQNTFQRIATLQVHLNHPDAEEAVSEIVAATSDGMLLIYTDGENGTIGFVDISNPSSPAPSGTLEVGGEPTSVAVVGNYALVGVNTSENYVNPTGLLVVVDITSRQLIRTLDMMGQPDSVAVSPDRQYAAVVIENERDEDLGDGEIPQLPAGFLMVVDLDGTPSQWSTRKIELTGLADLAPEDPEPEFADINTQNVAAVTLQENNHIILVDLASGSIIDHFNAGTVNLENVDILENGIIEVNGDLNDIPREPDAITWVGDEILATANEGDMYGGSRGFTLFTQKGNVISDSFNQVEHLAVQIGHYPEGRAENKGAEPEGVEYGRYGQDDILFVGCERANFVAVYQVTHYGTMLIQVLPTGVGPEGLLAIPQRDLFVVATEKDDAGEPGVAASLSIYQLQAAVPSYPTIQSSFQVNESGVMVPIAWTALSGLVADIDDAAILYTVPDNAMAQSRIYTVDASSAPALIVDELILMKDGSPVDYDLEGIAVRADGGFWLASEGKNEIENLLIKVDVDGTVLEEVGLPDSVKTGMIKNGFEGVTAVGSGADEKVYVAFQRTWNNDLTQHARIGEYNPATGQWRFFYYPLDAKQSDASGWIGLSEITALGNDNFAVIERDKGWGPDALLKSISTFSIAGLEPQTEEQGNFPVVTKSPVYDMVPDLRALNGWTLEKVEGLAVASDGQVYVVTDNDGIDDATGETQFLRLGDREDVLGL